MESGSHTKRQVNSGFTWCANKNCSSGALSSSVMPAMPAVCATFTYSALRPVSGCVRARGERAAFLDAVFARLAHVGLGAAADALQAVQQALHGGRQRIPGGVLAGEQRVAAIGRHFPGQQHRAHGRLLQVGGVRMPDAAEGGVMCG
jgi:hypothetical protein